MKKILVVGLMLAGLASRTRAQDDAAFFKNMLLRKAADSLRQEFATRGDDYGVNPCRWSWQEAVAGRRWGKLDMEAHVVTECSFEKSVSAGDLRRFGYTVTIPEAVIGGAVYRISTIGGGDIDISQEKLISAIIKEVALSKGADSLRKELSAQGDSFEIRDCHWIYVEVFGIGGGFLHARCPDTAALTVGDLRKYGYSVTIPDAIVAAPVFRILGKDGGNVSASGVRLHAFSAALDESYPRF